MIVKQHTLVKYEFQSGNVPHYRHYVECSCGWQGRCGTETAAKSQYDNHLANHGVEPYFSNLAEPVEEQVTDASPEGVAGNLTLDDVKDKLPDTNTPPLQPQGGIQQLGGTQIKSV